MCKSKGQIRCNFSTVVTKLARFYNSTLRTIMKLSAFESLDPGGAVKYLERVHRLQHFANSKINKILFGMREFIKGRCTRGQYNFITEPTIAQTCVRKFTETINVLR